MNVSAHQAIETAPSKRGDHVIITPIWRPRLDPIVERMIRLTEKTNADVQRVFVGPRGLDTGFYKEMFPSWEWLAFEPHDFVSVHSYSTWMTTPQLYDALAEYAFMTMCQQDALLLRPVTEIDMTSIDYIGAVWDPPVRVFHFGSRAVVGSSIGSHQGPRWVRSLGRPVPVGNGGLSTRRVAAMQTVSRSLMERLPQRLREGLLEDVYYCALGPRHGLRIASVEQAATTYAESDLARRGAVDQLVGVHGAHRWNPKLLESILEPHVE